MYINRTCTGYRMNNLLPVDYFCVVNVKSVYVKVIPN